jgi:hypothetical protein
MKEKVIDQAGYFKNTLPLSQRGKVSSVSGLALLSLGRGTLPAQPSNGFLNTHPDLFYLTDLEMLFSEGNRKG